MLLSKADKRRHYQRVRLKLYCSAGFLVLLLIFGFYGLLNFPALKIKKIEIEGVTKLEDIRPTVLSGALARVLGASNFYSWPKKVGMIDIKKDYSTGTLTLVGIASERFAIWCAAVSSAQASCFWVNREGLALEEAPDTEGASIAKVNDNRDLMPVTGKPILLRYFPSVTRIIAGLANLPISIASFSYNDRLQELTATGVRGERMIFSVRFILDEKALTSLGGLIQSGKLRNSEYADFTVENRIYLK